MGRDWKVEKVRKVTAKTLAAREAVRMSAFMKFQKASREYAQAVVHRTENVMGKRLDEDRVRRTAAKLEKNRRKRNNRQGAGKMVTWKK
jgi:hypothetical protein